MHKPNYDIENYLASNQDQYTLEDIESVEAFIPGHNDEDKWYWIVKLKAGSYVYTEAWCDYTGWDCHSGGRSVMTTNAYEAAMQAPEYIKEYDIPRRPRQTLLDQLNGLEPYGVETFERIIENKSTKIVDVGYGILMEIEE